MLCGNLRSYVVLLYILSFIFSNVVNCLQYDRDIKVLNVGVELWKESLPLQRGSRVYQLEGLKQNMRYEVKISYPASIPCSFSLHLRRGDPSLSHMHGRKLLNTEKIIFKTDSLEFASDQDKYYVLVTVEAAGVVALPHVQERKDIIFNIGNILNILMQSNGIDALYLCIARNSVCHFCGDITHLICCPVCDELLLGIPRYTWWVVFLVVLCLGLSLVLPYFLPSFLLREDRSSNSAPHILSKNS